MTVSEGFAARGGADVSVVAIFNRIGEKVCISPFRKELQFLSGYKNNKEIAK